MRSVSVGDLTSALGSPGLTLVSDAAGAHLAIRWVVVYDALGPLPTTSGGMLLLAGVAPESEEAMAVARAAAGREFTALVVRARQDDDTRALATLCDQFGIALLAVPADVEWLQLGSVLTTLLDATRDAEDRSPALGDLFGLANAIAASVGGATAIEDLARRVLAYSTVAGQPIDPDRREGILGRQVPDLPENDDQYRELYRASGVVRFDAEPPALPRLAVTVRAGAEPLGSIWVVDAGPGLRPTAEQTLASAAQVAALHLLRARSSEDLARQQRGELVRGLLLGDLPAAATLGRLGMDAAGPYAVLAFTPLDVPEEHAHRLPGLLDLQLGSRLGRTAACVLGGVTYALASGPRIRSADSLASLARDVVATARSALRIDLVAAVGRLVPRPESIPASYTDSDRALALLLLEPSRGSAGSAEALAAPLVLERLAPHLADDALVSTTAGARALEHDARRGTAYAPLLRTWLDRGRDVAATAEALAVHPNTVRYRLRGAAKALSVDLDDPDQALLLWLVLRNA